MTRVSSDGVATVARTGGTAARPRRRFPAASLHTAAALLLASPLTARRTAPSSSLAFAFSAPSRVIRHSDDGPLFSPSLPSLLRLNVGSKRLGDSAVGSGIAGGLVAASSPSRGGERYCRFSRETVTRMDMAALSSDEEANEGRSGKADPETAADVTKSAGDGTGPDDGEESWQVLAKSVFMLVAIQSLLAPVSVGVAALLHVPNSGLGSGFALSAGAILDGIRWTGPLVALAVVLEIAEPYVPALQDVSRATQGSVLRLLGSKRRPLFALGSSVLLGAAAGLGEEWLFRGVAQSALSTNLGLSDGAAVGVASVIFGLLHAVTPAYALLATAASAFFGWLYLTSGNLAVPIVCHGVYDVAALMWAHWSVTDPNMTEEELDKIWEFGAPDKGGSTDA